MDSPHALFLEKINIQTQKEKNNDIWKDSEYKDLVKLQCNNCGNVGETFIQALCDTIGILATVDGGKTKKIGGGGIGDGIIAEKSVEIKTSYRGSSTPSFQHELGEIPWSAEFMLFIDVAPDCIYITIFKNFTEEVYTSGNKCLPYFPTKSITWRKKKGAFKLDTTVKINEDNITKGYTIKITSSMENTHSLREFIMLHIN